MKVMEVSPTRLLALRGKRSREVIAHELRKCGWGSDAKAIWRYETGRNQPSARILPDYARILGVASVDDLYGDADDAEDRLPSLDIHLLEQVYLAVGAAVALEKARVRS